MNLRSRQANLASLLFIVIAVSGQPIFGAPVVDSVISDFNGTGKTEIVITKANGKEKTLEVKDDSKKADHYNALYQAQHPVTTSGDSGSTVTYYGGGSAGLTLGSAVGDFLGGATLSGSGINSTLTGVVTVNSGTIDTHGSLGTGGLVLNLNGVPLTVYGTGTSSGVFDINTGSTFDVTIEDPLTLDLGSTLTSGFAANINNTDQTFTLSNGVLTFSSPTAPTTTTINQPIQTALVITGVPEVSTLDSLLVGLGALALVFVVRRKVSQA